MDTVTVLIDRAQRNLDELRGLLNDIRLLVGKRDRDTRERARAIETAAGCCRGTEGTPCVCLLKCADDGCEGVA